MNKYHMIPFIWGTQNKKFIEKESRIQVSGVAGREGSGNYSLMGTEFLWGWWKNSGNSKDGYNAVKALNAIYCTL